MAFKDDKQRKAVMAMLAMQGKKGYTTHERARKLIRERQPDLMLRSARAKMALKLMKEKRLENIPRQTRKALGIDASIMDWAQGAINNDEFLDTRFGHRPAPDSEKRRLIHRTYKEMLTDITIPEMVDMGIISEQDIRRYLRRTGPGGRGLLKTLGKKSGHELKKMAAADTDERLMRYVARRMRQIQRKEAN